ncbi:MAG: DNA translocase FtsK 4TM domain-containing protein, partial [Holophagales bacterium]|nr:DNA translocase FtsK 4TM domain-containing protein [Holophagales bacterium]
MSTAASTRTAKTFPRLPISPEKGNEILGFVLTALVVLLFGSLASHHALDPSWLHHRAEVDGGQVRNFVGPFGAQLSAICFALLGLVSFLLPLFLAIEAWRRLTHRPRPDVAGRGIGMASVLVVSPGLLQLLAGEVSWRGVPIDSGGSAGVLLSDLLSAELNPGGAFVVLLSVLLVGGSLAAKSTLRDLFTVWRSHLAESWQRLRLAVAQHHKRRRERDKSRRVIEQQARSRSDGRPLTPRVTRGGMAAGGIEPLPPRPAGTASGALITPPTVAPSGGPSPSLASPGRLDLPLRVTERKGEGSFGVRKVRLHPPGEPTPEEGAPDSPGLASPRSATPVRAPVATRPPSPPTLAGEASNPGPSRAPSRAPAVGSAAATAHGAAARGRSARAGAAGAPAVPRARSLEPGHLPPTTTPAPPLPQQADLDMEVEVPELPPVNLLTTDRPRLHHDEAELVERGGLIHESCEHFGVEGEIAGISPGPVITVFEFQPAPGVKVSKVVNLQDDLALALRADSVRIDRIPGRSTLGMEVPNARRSIIHLGQLLDEEAFAKAKSPLTMALGVDIHGRPVYHDLATMPHLLVAGATGAGKSVGLQSMITSILYKATKEDVKFIFIDPKRVELGVYSEIPHLKTEVVVEPKKA